MLDRSKSGRVDQRRARRVAWQRDYRRRQREGSKLIEATPALIELAIAGKMAPAGRARRRLG